MKDDNETTDEMEYEGETGGMPGETVSEDVSERTEADLEGMPGGSMQEASDDRMPGGGVTSTSMDGTMPGMPGEGTMPEMSGEAAMPGMSGEGTMPGISGEGAIGGSMPEGSMGNGDGGAGDSMQGASTAATEMPMPGEATQVGSEGSHRPRAGVESVYVIIDLSTKESSGGGNSL